MLVCYRTVHFIGRMYENTISVFSSMIRALWSCSSCTAAWMRLLLFGVPLGFLLWTPSHCSESVNIHCLDCRSQESLANIFFMRSHTLCHLFSQRNYPTLCFPASWKRWPGEMQSYKNISTITRLVKKGLKRIKCWKMCHKAYNREL